MQEAGSGGGDGALERVIARGQQLQGARPLEAQMHFESEVIFKIASSVSFLFI